METSPSKTQEIESSNQQAASLPLNGMDPITEHLLSRGLQVTRANWIAASGLEEPLDLEHEAMLEEALQTEGFSSLDEPMDKAVSEVEAWGARKFPQA